MYEKLGGCQLTLSTLIFLHFVKFSAEEQLNFDTLHAMALILKMIQLNTTPNVVKQPVMLD